MNAHPVTERDVLINAAGPDLPGILGVPPGASGVVLFAHGSGSGRHSPRNNLVAHSLQREGLATMLVDLLTEREAADRRSVFNIRLLAQRLLAVTAWLRRDPATSELPVGYFGASTGGGAALVAAAEAGDIGAVVSRGGRPDLAGPALTRVTCPVLLIVGGNDPQVVALNQEAMAELRVPKELAIIPGATHLFEEPGALERVARLAGAWFTRYLGHPGAADR
ncbi:MAG TPA: alpha/beta family hydrolase [Chloroflexota bacterium]|nr:alpha/beta family hydrolase [Chloroflexota bacterium]